MANASETNVVEGSPNCPRTVSSGVVGVRQRTASPPTIEMTGDQDLLIRKQLDRSLLAWRSESAPR